MTPKLIFLHIEKAAGSSLRTLFHDNFGKRNVYWHDINSDSIHKYNVIGGHRSLPFYRKDDELNKNKAIYLGVMREPVSRVISFYAHLKRHTDYFSKNKASSFKDAVLNCKPFRAHIESGQLTYLIGNKEFSNFERIIKDNSYVIGTMDKLDSFTKLISDKLHLNTSELTQVNLGLPGYKDEIDLDNETLSELKRLVHEDIKLYDFIIEKHSGLFNNTSDSNWIKVKNKLASLPHYENKSFEGSCFFENIKAIPTRLAVRKAFTISVTLKNNSTSLWTSKGGALNFSYHWLDSNTGKVVIFEGARTPIDEKHTIPPQGEITRKIKVITPNTPGEYQLQLIPMKTKHSWFDKYKFDSSKQSFIIHL